MSNASPSRSSFQLFKQSPSLSARPHWRQADAASGLSGSRRWLQPDALMAWSEPDQAALDGQLAKFIEQLYAQDDGRAEKSLSNL